MTVAELLALAAAGLVGSAAQSATGFGIALVIAPVALAVLDVEDAVLLVALASLVHNVLVVADRRGALELRRRDALAVGGAAVPGLVVGAAIVGSIEKAPLQLVLAASVLAAVATRLHEPGRSALLAARSAAVPVGLLAGTLTTTVGVNGPPLVIWLRAKGAAIGELRDTLAAIFLALNLAASAILAARGGSPHVDALAALAVGLGVGHPLGMLAGRRLPAERLHGALTALLVVAAAATALAGIRGLAG